MATYVIGGYSAASLLTGGGGAPSIGSSVMLDPAFSAASSALTFTVTDADPRFSGSAGTQTDPDQTVVVSDSSGAVVASGPVRLGLASTFSQPGGGTVTLYEVWVGETLTGYVADAPLVPGISVTVTGQTDTTVAGPLYTSLVSPTYAPAANTAFVGGAGNDSILAGAGNDTISADAGNDTVDGGTGNDSISGGAGNDLIFAGDGADTILDGTGNDTVFGGAGNDLIDDAGGFNSSSDPTLAFGEAGNDTIFGTAGDDTLFGGSENDQIGGDGGSDFLSGDDGDDTLTGDTGNDTLTGGAGNDRLDGGTDDDSLTGDAGNDILIGGAGNDTISGGAGTDSLVGDAGNDLFRINDGEGIDSVFGGTGTDTLDYSGAAARAINVTFTSTGGGTHTFSGQTTSGTFSAVEAVIGTGLNDTISGAFHASGLRVDAGAGNDSVTGGGGADTLAGGAGNDTLTGGGGSDLFLLADGGGTDAIFGGTGANDRIDASGVTGGLNILYSGTGAGSYSGSGTAGSFTGIESFVSGAGNDTLTGSGAAEWVDGGAGDDLMFGGGGADTLTGGAGDDTLRGGAGGDQLFGGDGDDRFVVIAGEGTDTITGGSGNDVLDATGLTTSVTLTLTGAAAGSITGGAGTFTFTQVESVALGSGNDTATGSSAGDTIDGGAGNDRLTGNGGADFLSGGAGIDTLEGGDGDDTLRGGAGADILWGGTGLDWVDYTGSDAAVLVNLSEFTVAGGHAEGDQLQGTDAVIGSGFDDTLIGFDDEALSGSDIYYNVLWGGEGNDFIDGRGGSDEIDAGAGNDTAFGGTGNDTVDGGAGNDLVYGGDGADALQGGDGQDLVDGGTGNDTLSGGAGNDTLLGGAGNDLIAGGDGNDVIAGGSGSDTLSGGAGNDIFALGLGNGTTTITDLALGSDRLDVSGMVDANGDPVDWADVTVTDDGNGNALLTFPGGLQVLLAGVTPAQATGPQALFNIGVPCFAGGSFILTPDGDRRIEDIRSGDLVITRDDGPQPVLWTGHRHLDAAMLDLRADLRPVVIRAGAFGPHDALMVSPQHSILVQTQDGERLARARHLAELGDNRFRVARGKKHVTYHHLLTPRHALLRSNGVWSESLYPGPMALSALGVTACLDLARSVPFLAPVLAGRADAASVYGPTVRPVAKRRGLTLLPMRTPVPA